LRVIHKPWGYEKIIYEFGKITFKIICINKGCRTSLQYHVEKTEAMVTMDDNCNIWYSNGDGAHVVNKIGEMVIINPMVRHRITSIKDTKIAELSYGSRRDIVRIEDDYGRKDVTPAV